MSKGALNVDKAIWELYENIPHLLCEQPYGKNGRYITYYAEERLYLVFDCWYHGFFLVEADSPIGAINQVNCDRLKYLPKEAENYPISENISKGIEEINKLMFENGNESQKDILSKYEAKAITRGNCMMCGKELDDGLFFCKDCEAKAESEG